MTSTPLILDGETLTIPDLIEAARYHRRVELSPDAKQKVQRSRALVEEIIADGRTVYGISTGFGELSKVKISADNAHKLQENLIMSHAVGVGKPFNHDVVRGAMILRANALAKGLSGVRVELIEALLDMINNGVVPFVPRKGSVGSSGDLAPLSHVAIVLMGKGEAFYEGERMSGGEALAKAGLEPIQLEAKEGLGLINGTQFMTSIGALVSYDALNLVRNAVVASSMSIEALKGTDRALDPRIHKARPHSGQVRCAKAMRSMLANSEIRKSHTDCEKVQDAYTLRCAPQVIGASLEAVEYAWKTVEVEMNSANDNPLVFPDTGEVISGGNFHGQPIAMAMDFLSMAMAEVGNISERTIDRLVNPHLSGLPAFLTKEGGLNSGYMIAQYTAAALVSENKVLAHPAVVDSIPTSAGQEDHNSMGTISARQAKEILKNVERVIGIEMLCATQGLDFHKPTRPAEWIGVAHDVVRGEVDELEDDRMLYQDIQKAKQMVKYCKVLKVMEEKGFDFGF